MNLEELRSVRNTERQKDSLQELRPAFYQEVGEYIGNLEDEREQVASQHDDPFASPDVTRLTDEIEAAKDVAEAIYERRMGKLVKQASLAAAGMAADSEGLTDEEEALFTDLVARIEGNKAEILSVLDGRDSPGSAEAGADLTGPEADDELGHRTGRAADSETDTPPAPPVDDPPSESDRTAGAADGDGFSVADAMGSEPADDSTRRTESAAADERADGGSSGSADAREKPSERTTEPPGADIDRVTVQITADVGSILGVDDREYTLASDDVVTLPAANADPLIERDAAEPLE